MNRHDVFIAELTKEAGISNLARELGVHPVDTLKDTISNFKRLASDPVSVMKENANFMWNPPAPRPNAGIMDKIFTNKWLQRYLGYVLPVQSAYDLATTPGANSDPENWGTLAGQTLGAFAVPLTGSSLGGAIATQLGITEIGKMLGRQAKNLIGKPIQAQRQVNSISDRYPDSQQKVY